MEIVGPIQHTLVPNNFWATPVQNPMDSGTMGLLMILSVFQYQTPTNPTYNWTLSQAGHAAYIQSGAQDFQDKLASKAEYVVRTTIRSIGVTDGQVGVLIGITNTIRTKELSLDGPRIQSVTTHLHVSENSANIGLGLEFK